MSEEGRAAGLYTAKELAALFGVRERSIALAVKEKGMPCRVIANKRIFSLPAIHEWIKAGHWEGDMEE